MPTDFNECACCNPPWQSTKFYNTPVTNYYTIRRLTPDLDHVWSRIRSDNINSIAKALTVDSDDKLWVGGNASATTRYKSNGVVDYEISGTAFDVLSLDIDSSGYMYAGGRTLGDENLIKYSPDLTEDWAVFASDTYVLDLDTDDHFERIFTIGHSAFQSYITEYDKSDGSQLQHEDMLNNWSVGLVGGVVAEEYDISVVDDTHFWVTSAVLDNTKFNVSEHSGVFNIPTNQNYFPSGVPYDISIDSSGALVTCGSDRVIKHHKNDLGSVMWVSDTYVGSFDKNSLAIDTNDDIYVAGGSGVFKVNGQTGELIGNAFYHGQEVLDITLDSSNNVYICGVASSDKF